MVRSVDNTVLRLTARNWSPNEGGTRKCNEHVLKLRCNPIWLAYTFRRRISWYSKGQCKTKLPLFFFKYQAAKRIRGIINIAPSILQIGTRWNETLFQAPAPLLPNKTVPGTLWIWDWVSSRPDLDDLGKRLPTPCWESNHYYSLIQNLTSLWNIIGSILSQYLMTLND
jgi:hypothetical protein